MSGKVQIADSVIWVTKIAGDKKLVSRILKMKAGEIIELEVDKFKGFWQKMKNGKNDRSTDGVKPKEEAQKHWKSLYSARKDQWASIRAVTD